VTLAQNQLGFVTDQLSQAQTTLGRLVDNLLATANNYSRQLVDD